MSNNSLSWYQDHLRDHYHNPRNKGALSGAAVIGHVQNPSCGDMVVFTVSLQENKVFSAAFDGSGCVMSQAAASMLTERVLGLNITDILALTSEDMERLIGIPVGPVRMRCVVLPLEALKKGLESYARSNQTHTSVS